MQKYQLLKKYFNFSEFRANQKEIIDQIISSKDTISVLPTGSGKSLIYQISGLILGGVTLVISPLISLMKDQVNNLINKKIKACFIASSLSKEEINIIYNNLNEYQFIYVTAERLQDEKFKNNVKNIKQIVIDEAHTLYWGLEFRKEILKIRNFIDTLDYKVIISCFTATANSSDLAFISKILRLTNPYITYNIPLKDNIKFIVIKDNFINNIYKIIKNNINNKIIIYTLTIKKANDLYNKLSKYFNICIYHGKLNNDQKISNQEAFSNGKINILIATNAFGMGIDIKDIRIVILYDLAANISDLIQQVGRAGRDNRLSYAYLCFNKESITDHKYFINKSDYKKAKAKDLKDVIKFMKASNKNAFIKKYYK